MNEFTSAKLKTLTELLYGTIIYYANVLQCIYCNSLFEKKILPYKIFKISSILIFREKENICENIKYI